MAHAFGSANRAIERLMRSEAFQVVPGSALPRRIHQTYASSELPPCLQSAPLKLQGNNPGWSYRFYDNAACESFIDSTYGDEIGALYRSINPGYGAARADLFRYLLMFRLGGVYLDIKSGATTPLDALLSYPGKILLSTWRNEVGGRFEGWGVHQELHALRLQEFQQWYIAAPPGHPYLKAVIRQVLINILDYLPGRDGVGAAGVLRTTGPIAFTKAVAAVMHLGAHEVVDSEGDLGLDYSVIDQGSERTHKILLAGHYTQRSDPVVRISGVRAARSLAHQVMKRLHRYSRRAWTLGRAKEGGARR